MNHRSTRREFLAATGAAVAGCAALAVGTAAPGAQTSTAPAIVSRRPLPAAVDVLVVGGGPAGIGAALGAARTGARTLLVENHSFFGGVAAWAMGMQMNQMRPGGKPRSQIHEVLIEKLKAYGDQAIRLGQHEAWTHVEYLVTEDDAMTGRTFADAIAWRSGFLDLGGQKGGKYVKMQIHDVPYRAILPEKLDGLLTAGRCISATHAGAAAGKSMGNCMATGHAAGVAGALCVKKNCLPRELKVPELQASLRRDGVTLDLEERQQKELR